MRHLAMELAGMPAMAVLLMWIPTQGAAQNPKGPAKTYTPRRMSDGHPDLQGTYDLATLTPPSRLASSPVAAWLFGVMARAMTVSSTSPPATA